MSRSRVNNDMQPHPNQDQPPGKIHPYSMPQAILADVDIGMSCSRGDVEPRQNQQRHARIVTDHRGEAGYIEKRWGLE